MFSSLFKKNNSQSDNNIINKDITIILDNGHGKNTSGKHSPKQDDGTIFYEWEFNRDIVKRVAEQLTSFGIKCEILVPEDTDISLTERCRRANRIYSKVNKRAFLISVHANAAGNDGKWHDGKGWEVWTSVGQTKSDEIASIFWNEMKDEFPTSKMRMDMSDGDVDKEKNFTILYNTKCPAILLENFFYDNKEECKLLSSNFGRTKIATAIVRAIKKTLMKLY